MRSNSTGLSRLSTCDQITQGGLLKPSVNGANEKSQGLASVVYIVPTGLACREYKLSVGVLNLLAGVFTHCHYED